jgi:four helix bundle protein
MMRARNQTRSYGVGSNLRVLDAARAVVHEIHQLIDGSHRGLLCVDQLRASATSITANIREAYGRRKGPDRKQFFRFARASAEETDEHMRGNFAEGRIPATHFWRIHNRVAVIVKMLNRLMSE